MYNNLIQIGAAYTKLCEGVGELPVYSTKRFGAYLLITCILGSFLGGLTIWGVNILSPIPFPRFYTQIVGYGVENAGTGLDPSAPLSSAFPLWGQMNYTLEIINDDIVESTLSVTAKRAPIPNIGHKITFRISFGRYAKLFPRLVNGILSWSGNSSDVHINETIAIHSTLAFDDDGIYELQGTEISDYSFGWDSFETNYYIVVEDGTIVQVTDRRPETNEPQGITYGGPGPFNFTAWDEAYDEQHMGKPLSPSWGQINHTLKILGDNTVESILNITAVTEPPLPYAIVIVQYGYVPGLIPRNLEGDLYWSGDLLKNQTINLSTKLVLENNGRYIIARTVYSYRLFYEMRYYVTVENNTITKVATSRNA